MDIDISQNRIRHVFNCDASNIYAVYVPHPFTALVQPEQTGLLDVTGRRVVVLKGSNEAHTECRPPASDAITKTLAQLSEALANAKAAGLPTIFVIECVADGLDYTSQNVFVEYLEWVIREQPAKLIVITSQFSLFRLLSRRLIEFPFCLIVEPSNTGQLQMMKFVCVSNLARSLFDRLAGKFGLPPSIQFRFQFSRGSTDKMDNREMVFLMRVIAVALCINVLVGILQWWKQPDWNSYLKSIASDLHALAIKR